MLFEIPPLVKQKMTKEIWVVSILFLMGLGLSILIALRVEIPITDISL